MEHDIAVDLSVLEELDFPIPCGHSQHGNDEFTHDDGPAKFIAVSFHDCPNEPNKAAPYFYPSCVVWASYVVMNRLSGKSIVCSRCGQLGLWSEFVNIIDTL